MFRFEEPTYLYFLLVIPVVLIGYYLLQLRSKKLRNKLASEPLFKRLAPNFSVLRQNIKFAMLLSALALLFVSWANPQWGRKKEKLKAQSSDIFVALDISQSMMATDISPNRLERAKRLAQNIVRSAKGNRVGLIYFAGNAYLQMPLSEDFSAAELFLQSANTDLAGTQGTAISEAIDLALRAFEDDKDYQRAMVIITDGETHDESVIEKVKDARQKGLVIFTVGIGTEEGGFVPFTERGREQFKRDKQGNPIKSKLNVPMLKDMADASGGSYYLIQEGNKIVPALKKELDKIEKQEVDRRSFSEYASYYQYFLFFGLIFLVFELIWPDGIKKLKQSAV